MFHVGQLVECVDETVALSGEPCPFTLGSVYTVASVRDLSGTNFKAHGTGLEIEEARVASKLSLWRATRFRPLSDSRLVIFRKMLAPSPEKERA